jgi:hypothetical protein
VSRNGLRFTSEADMPEGMRKLLQSQQQAVPMPRGLPRIVAPDSPGQAAPMPLHRFDELSKSPDSAPKRRKYGNQITTVDGIRFDSKREARYYEQLKLRRAAGEVRFWLRQVPVHLPGGTKYVLDFVVFLTSGDCQFVDVKGRETKEFRIKRREVEHHYPFRILLA